MMTSMRIPVSFCLAATGAALVGGIAVHRSLPDVSGVANYRPPLTTRILDRDGKLIGTLSKEDRVWVGLERIPPALQDAIVAIEDRRFYRHGGVDVLGVLRAGVGNAAQGGVGEGASTLTMQLARRIYLTTDVSLERKLQEVLLAMRMEQRLSKSRILELYLNTVYFGQGTYGVERAAQHYFRKPVGRLTTAESACLAALPQAPEYLCEPDNASELRLRQQQVLHSMHELGMVAEDEYRTALHEQTPLRPAAAAATPWKAPYFTTYVIHELSQRYDEKTLYGGGLTVQTTLDSAAQERAERAVTSQLQRHGGSYNASQAAVVTLENHTGQVLAMVGGRGWNSKSQFNRAWQAQRAAGSTFKAVVYTAAIESGRKPTDKIDDAPTSLKMDAYTSWSPRNSDHRYMGRIPLWRALEQSRNVVSAKLVAQLSPRRVLDLAHRFGLAEGAEPNLSLALGAVDVTPLQLASAYSVLGSNGKRNAPAVVLKVSDAREKVLESYEPHPTRVVSPQTAMVMTRMLQNVVAGGTGRAASLPGEQVAGKTGTTDLSRDAWFVGYTRKRTTAVWVGNDDQQAMWNCYGGTLPAFIFRQAMLTK